MCVDKIFVNMLDPIFYPIYYFDEFLTNDMNMLINNETTGGNSWPVDLFLANQMGSQSVRTY